MEEREEDHEKREGEINDSSSSVCGSVVSVVVGLDLDLVGLVDEDVVGLEGPVYDLAVEGVEVVHALRDPHEEREDPGGGGGDDEDDVDDDDPVISYPAATFRGGASVLYLPGRVDLLPEVVQHVVQRSALAPFRDDADVGELGARANV